MPRRMSPSIQPKLIRGVVTGWANNLYYSLTVLQDSIDYADRSLLEGFKVITESAVSMSRLCCTVANELPFFTLLL